MILFSDYTLVIIVRLHTFRDIVFIRQHAVRVKTGTRHCTFIPYRDRYLYEVPYIIRF